MDGAALDGTALDKAVLDDAVLDATPLDASGADSDPDELPSPRVIVVGRNGEVAAIGLQSPWPLLKSATLGARVNSARYGRGRIYVVHPSPVDRLSVLRAKDLTLVSSLALPKGSDPRDVALVDDTVVVGLHASPQLRTFDRVTHAPGKIDLGLFADADGAPEAATLASCGSRLYVGLQRLDKTAKPTPKSVSPVLAVVDLTATGAQLVDADPSTPGIQGVALGHAPSFDMHADCAGGTLYVSEPVPLFQGGGTFEAVNLTTLAAKPFLPKETGQAGGLALLSHDVGWFIGHTEFGPGPSTHLSQFNPTSGARGVWSTFAFEHIDNLALDVATDQLFFPDSCTTDCQLGGATGVQVFRASTGDRLSTAAIKVGFLPFDVVVAR